MKHQTDASRHARHPRYKWAVVGMLWAICFFNYADRQAIFSVFPLLEREMGLSPVQLGILGSAFAWVYGLGAPLAGIIVDRVRRKTAILGGLHVWSIVCMATALSRNFRHLVLFRAAEGAGETFYYPASVSLISDYHDKGTRSRAMGFLVTSVYFGTIAGGFFAGWIGQNYGWRSSFVVFGALGVLLGIALQRFLHEPERSGTEGTGASTASKRTPGVMETGRLLLKTPTVLCLMFAFICANFVAVVLLSWMPKFLYEKYGVSLAAAGLGATVLAQIPSMFGAFAGGWLADVLVKRTNRGRILVQAVAVFAGAPFVAIAGLTQSATWLVVALIGWGFFKGLYDANIFASVFDVVRSESRGTVAGLMNCAGWLAGGGTAPIVVGLIAQTSSLGFAIAATAAVYLAAGISLLAATAFISGDIHQLEASSEFATATRES